MFLYSSIQVGNLYVLKTELFIEDGDSGVYYVLGAMIDDPHIKDRISYCVVPSNNGPNAIGLLLEKTNWLSRYTKFKLLVGSMVIYLDPASICEPAMPHHHQL